METSHRVMPHRTLRGAIGRAHGIGHAVPSHRSGGTGTRMSSHNPCKCSGPLHLLPPNRMSGLGPANLDEVRTLHIS